MTIQSNEIKEKKESGETFIHVQDLPWLAYSKDVREFFDGLSVKKNGVLFRQYDAFVSFDDPRDVHLAICRKNRAILGSPVRLSVIDEFQLQKALFRIAKRRLDFEKQDGIYRSSNVDNGAPKKKIRPTPVVPGGKRKGEECSAFCPEESDMPPPQHATNDQISVSCPRGSRYQYVKRKIHPIQISESDNLENFVVFHPQECFEFKKRKLDIQ